MCFAAGYLKVAEMETRSFSAAPLRCHNFASSDSYFLNDAKIVRRDNYVIFQTAEAAPW